MQEVFYLLEVTTRGSVSSLMDDVKRHVNFGSQKDILLGSKRATPLVAVEHL